jgi:hypothetical protein
MNSSDIFFSSGSTSWLTAASFVYRYRGDHLRANIFCDMTPGIGNYWQWRVGFVAWPGGAVTNLYTEATSTKFSNFTGGEWGTEAAIDMSGQGLTLGDWIMIVFEIKSSAPSDLRAIRYLCQRYSTGASDFETLTDWKEGDDDIGDTNLNKISDNLLLFYTGGDEELWGYTSAVRNTKIMNQYRLTAPHLRRWLHYKVITGETPTLYYGIDHATTSTLTTDTGWLVYDMYESEVAPGTTYELTGCEGAFESESSTL